MYTELSDDFIATNEVIVAVDEIPSGFGRERKYSYKLQYAIVDRFLYSEKLLDYITTRVLKS